MRGNSRSLLSESRPQLLRRLIPALAVLVLLGACGSDEARSPSMQDGSAQSAQGNSVGPAEVPAESVALPPSAGQLPMDSLSDVEMARGVIEEYYAAIDAQDYRRAYAQWGDEGRSSEQTFEEFSAGFQDTERVTVTVGEAGRVEGAAGSRYVEIPVVVDAETRSGNSQQFEGSYTLRRAVVDGATPTQRRWHFYLAQLNEVQ